MQKFKRVSIRNGSSTEGQGSKPLRRRFIPCTARSTLALRRSSSPEAESSLGKDNAASSKKKPLYKRRRIRELPPGREKHYAALCVAKSQEEVKQALANLGVYSPELDQLTCWKRQPTSWSIGDVS